MIKRFYHFFWIKSSISNTTIKIMIIINYIKCTNYPSLLHLCLQIPIFLALAGISWLDGCRHIPPFLHWIKDDFILNKNTFRMRGSCTVYSTHNHIFLNTWTKAYKRIVVPKPETEHRDRDTKNINFVCLASLSMCITQNQLLLEHWHSI